MTDLSFISQKKRKLNLQKFNILLFTILFLLFHDFPLGNGAFGTVETDANFYESLTAGLNAESLSSANRHALPCLEYLRCIDRT